MCPDLPISLQRCLRRFAWRRRIGQAARAAGLACAFLAGSVLGACLIDRFWPLTSWARLALLPGVSAAAVLLLRPWQLLGWWRTDWLVIAADIERHGQFGQQLQTLVAQSLERPAYRGSGALLAQIARNVESQVAADPPRMSWAPILRPWVAASFVCLSAVMLLPSEPLGLRLLLQRLMQPQLNLPPVSSTRLHVQPGDVDLVQNQSLTITVRARRLPEEALDLYTSQDGQSWVQHLLLPRSDGQFVFTVPSVERDLRYYLAGGDATTSIYSARVHRPPSVNEFQVRYEFPSYLDRAPQTLTTMDPSFQAPADTVAMLGIVPSEPLRHATLRSGSASIPLSLDRQTRQWQARLVMQRDQAMELHMLSAYGLSGRSPQRLMLRAIPDRPPSARLLWPTEDFCSHTRQELTVAYQASDDNALAAVYLIVQVNGRQVRQIPLTMAGDLRQQQGQVTLDPSGLDAHVGDVLSFAVAAEDRSPGPSRRSVSDFRHVVLALGQMDSSQRQRLAELRQAWRLAESLAAELTAARDLSLATIRVPTDPAGHYARAAQALGSAVDAGLLAERALLRAIMQKAPPQQATALASWLDQTRQLLELAGQLGSSLRQGEIGLSALDKPLAQPVATAAQLAAALKVSAQGLQAQLAMAVLANLNWLNQYPAPEPRRGEMLRVAQQSLDAVLDDLGLRGKPLTAVEPELRRKMEFASQVEQGQSPVDFQAAAQRWTQALIGGSDRTTSPSRTSLDARLDLAAAAELARADAIAQAAADLRLAGRVGSLLESLAASEPTQTKPRLEQFPSLVGALQRPAVLSRRQASPAELEPAKRTAAQARQQLQSWLRISTSRPHGSAAEELAISASIASEKGDYPEAAKLDADWARRSSSTTRPLSPEHAMEQARQLARLRDRQAELAANATTAGARADALATQQAHLLTEIQRLHGPTTQAAAALLTADQLREQLQLLPAGLARLWDAAQSERSALAAVHRAQAQLAAASPAQRPAATQAMYRQTQQLHQATTQAVAAADAVSLARLDHMARGLSQLCGSDAADALILLQSPLRSAVAAAHEASRTADAAAWQRHFPQARTLSEQIATLLRQMPSRLVDDQPRAVAAWHATRALDGLKQGKPDLAIAAQQQRLASEALDQALQQTLQTAAAARHAAIGTLSGAYRNDPRATRALLAGRGAPVNAAPQRQWGHLQPLSEERMLAPARQADMPAFEDALRAYFEALNRQAEGVRR